MQWQREGGREGGHQLFIKKKNEKSTKSLRVFFKEFFFFGYKILKAQIKSLQTQTQILVFKPKFKSYPLRNKNNIQLLEPEIFLTQQKPLLLSSTVTQRNQFFFFLMTFFFSLPLSLFLFNSFMIISLNRKIGTWYHMSFNWREKKKSYCWKHFLRLVVYNFI